MTDWRILEGDCQNVLRTLPAQSIHTVVTSPPYYGLRDYGTDGQLGLEATPDGYVAALIAVFREVRRVLRDDGTAWLNLGDSFNAYNGGAGPGSKLSKTQTEQRPKLATGYGLQVKSLKPKDLLGIPWMVAFALRADGWYLRSDIIWSKPNPMPESVTDRPTKAHEYVFLLSKSARYYYDADAIREPHEGPMTDRRMALGMEKAGPKHDGRAAQGLESGNGFSALNPAGRNKRSVWPVATQPYAGAHFATFPPKLIEPCILAGSPERACGECGTPWTRVVERTAMVVRPAPKRAAWQAEDEHARTQTGGTMLEPPLSRTVGWEPSCDHEDGAARGVVLDPFCGAGTAGLVAAQHGRDFIGIELSSEYVAMARERIETFVRLGFRSPNGNGHIAPEQDMLFEGLG